jgi:hypothetical protein
MTVTVYTETVAKDKFGSEPGFAEFPDKRLFFP